MPKLSCRSLLVGAALTGAIDEAIFVSTNARSQHGLAAVHRLALIGDHLS